MLIGAIVRDGLTAVGSLLLAFNGSALLLAWVSDFGEGWKVWGLPVTAVALWLLALRMVQVRVGQELRIRRAGHRRAAWANRRR